MLWNLIKHHRLTCFFACSILFSFFFSFGISSNSFATEWTCSYTGNRTSTHWDLNLYLCPGYLDTLPANTPLWVSYDYSIELNSAVSNRNTFYIGVGVDTNNYYNLNYLKTNAGTSYSYKGVFSIPDKSYATYSAINIPANQSFTYTLVFSDTDPSSGGSCPECEVCQVCPAIPDNPYDSKLDNITKAVYTCGAILIMLYFFFCIYQIIIKHGGSR